MSRRVNPDVGPGAEESAREPLAPATAAPVLRRDSGKGEAEARPSPRRLAVPGTAAAAGVLVGSLAAIGLQSGLFGRDLGSLLLMDANVLVLAAMVWGLARLLDRLDTGLRRVAEALGRKEQALRRSEARKAAILESTLDCMLALDEQGRITEFNPAAERTFGYARAEALGRPLATLIASRTPDRAAVGGIRDLVAGDPGILGHRIDLTAMRADGTEFPTELAVTPIRIGESLEFTAVLRDISDRVTAESMLREVHEKLDARVRERTAALAEANEALRLEVAERARAEQAIRGLNDQMGRRLGRIDSLHRIDRAITASPELRPILRVVLAEARSQLRVDAAAVLLCDPEDKALRFALGKGFRRGDIVEACLALGADCAGVDGPRPLAEGSTDRGEVLAGEGFLAYQAVPLVAKGELKGVLEVFHRAPLQPDEEWLGFLDALAAQAAIAIDNAALFRNLERSRAELELAYDATIEGWARALDLRDKETEGHTRRVTEMSLRLARAFNLGDEDLVHIRRGAMLHDIGKMGIPDAILLKPAALTPEERAIMQRHPTYAYEWLTPVPYLGPALEIPYAHHERWDGTGYPRGLKGEAIPLAARIFAAVDIWDALRSDRPYRKGWPDIQVRKHLRTLSGTHLDPAVVEAFLVILEADAAGAAEGREANLEAGPATPSAGPGPGPEDRPGPEGEAISLEGRLAAQLSLATELNRHLEGQREELARANARLAELAATDELTGLRNRRHFREALEAGFSFAVRQEQPISVVMLDVDHFKAYNDTYGHPAGDEVLRTLAELLRANLRPHDVVARHGGEEFAILLAATDAHAGRVFAERLRAIIAAHPWPLRPVTASLGVATMPPDVLSALELVEEADRALYESKRLGRNRVTHYLNEDIPTAVSSAEFA